MSNSQISFVRRRKCLRRGEKLTSRQHTRRYSQEVDAHFCLARRAPPGTCIWTNYFFWVCYDVYMYTECSRASIALWIFLTYGIFRPIWNRANKNRNHTVCRWINNFNTAAEIFFFFYKQKWRIFQPSKFSKSNVNSDSLEIISNRLSEILLWGWLIPMILLRY